MTSNPASRLRLALAAAMAGAAALAAEPPWAAAWQECCAALARTAGERGTMTVVGRAGPPGAAATGPHWLFLAAELRHLGAGPFWGARAAAVSRAHQPASADPLPAILDFHNQLKQAGVALIVAPVPPKAVIYPEFIPDSPASSGARADAALQAFYRLLQAQGVRVLDLTPLFLANRGHADGAPYCRQDSHWSGNGCVLAAAALARELESLPGITRGAPGAMTATWRTLAIQGDLRQALPEPRPEAETVRLRQVTPAGSTEPVKPDQSSPVILLGDSHNLVFQAGGDDMHARGAGLADQLALELGQAVDLVAVRGSGATPARINLLRRAQKDPAYWKNKRAVIWCFAAREFTESDGWRQVPIAPPAAK